MSCVRNCALLISLLSATLTPAQATSLYKWTDEQGTVHYSQIPPTERPAKEIAPETPKPSNPSKPAEAEEAVNGSAAEAPLPEGMTQTKDASAQLNRKNCETARSNLAIYQSSSKVIEPDGTELVLSNEMREAKLKETQEQIKLYCQ